MSSSYSNRAIEPFRLLQESLSETGPIYLPLLLLATPTTVLSIAQEVFSPVKNGVMQAITPLNIGLWLLSIPVSVIMISTILHFVYRYLRERTVDVSGAFNKGLGMSLNAFMGYVLYILAIFVGFLLLFVPGVYLSVSLGFFLYAMVSDNCSLFDSFKYSMNLVKGRWWPTFGSMLVGVLILLPLLFVAMAVSTFAVIAWKSSGETFSSILINLISLIFVPFLNVFYMKLYMRLQDTANFNQ